MRTYGPPGEGTPHPSESGTLRPRAILSPRGTFSSPRCLPYQRGRVTAPRPLPPSCCPSSRTCAGEGGLGGGMGEPPACSYLEKILSKNLELMERRLTDYLDERLRALQEHVDGKVALLAHLLQTHLLQSPGSPPPPPGMPLTRYDSGDRLSNGER
ncbi:hypothetical protein D623_10011635 [Myotis brandtii]|uniref:Uncharacterized protein n=1 Tax=Myotis brandtii TaxID=109478 RepID=S7NHI9_MYOBR|nr:PREDICTED: uncharacterized protein C10orf88 [Myotis brandtii]EPQ16821.1 hypothetical protein D623_10011635 [Myotis brandtii]